MCGITGYFYKKGKKIDTTSTIIDMLKVQKHRGPDDGGIRAFSLEHAASHPYSVKQPEAVHSDFEGVVGFNRLSILDLSINGHQPMCSPDEQVILGFNGEVYNAFDFKPELEADGYKFRSGTDTEVILYLYLKYGFDGMISRLNGMFAINVIDLRHQKFYIARDRFGIKPMYIYENDETIAFSSELKSFTFLPDFKASLDETLLDEYLLFRNNINNTLFKNVKGLTPGTYLSYTHAEGFKSHTYFNAENYQRQNETSISLEETKSSLGEKLKESVKRQLISDVKLGCQLSGGIDSSLITYFANELKQDDLLETISIILDNQVLSEEPYMDQAAGMLKVKAHKFKLDSDYYLDKFEDAIWHFEGPLNHPNTIGIYLLSQQAKNYVTVLLSGEGADELFGGYTRFANVKNPYNLRKFLSDLKKNRNTPFSFIKSYLDPAYRGIMASAFMTNSFASSLKPDFNLNSASEPRFDLYNKLSGSPFDKQIKYDLQTYLPDLLIRQDKMSMAHSIENRVPFLDNELVDHSFTIPEKHLVPDKASENQTKYALKELAADKFGKQFAFRQKQGFGIPLKDFFNDPKFNSYLKDEIIPGISSRGIFNGDLVKKWIYNINNLTATELDALWITISFEAWMKKYKLT